MDRKYIDPFTNSTKEMIKEMTGIEITNVSEPIEDKDDFFSLGVSTIITFSGKIKGRFIIDMPPEVAKMFVEKMTGEKQENLKDKLFLAGISEMNNIISGDANTYLNNNLNLGLRLAPPIVFTGKNPIVSTPKIDASTVFLTTKQGEFKINIAFQGGVF